jgi:hypothetical protein
MIRQYRHPLRKVQLEFLQGILKTMKVLRKQLYVNYPAKIEWVEK